MNLFTAQQLANEVGNQATANARVLANATTATADFGQPF
jgi:hypothetical protein